MYHLTDEQVDFILNDIRRNGIETEDLQLNLLDHICCIIEENLEENGDFEAFYFATVKRFYKQKLSEIEEETLLLLKFKNYYAMRKVMLVAGTISVFAFIFGCFFKVMYWPGATMMLVLAIAIFGFIFLPLLAVLKVKETKNAADKLQMAAATTVGIMYFLSSLFLMQHWPGARIMWFSTLGILFLFIPVYFFTGIRDVEKKANTIIITMLLVGVTCIQFTMTGLRPSAQTQGNIYSYLQTEEMLNNIKKKAPRTSADPLAVEIQKTCEQLKNQIVLYQFGSRSIPLDFDKQVWGMRDILAAQSFFGREQNKKLLLDLKDKVTKYNTLRNNKEGAIPLKNSVLDNEIEHKHFFTTLYALNNLAQLQLFLECADHTDGMSMK